MCCKIGVTKVCFTKRTLKRNLNKYNVTECTIKRNANEYHITECAIKPNVTEFYITERARKPVVNDFHVIECIITRRQIFMLLTVLQNMTSRNSCSVCHEDLLKNVSRITRKARLIQNVSLRSQTSGILCRELWYWVQTNRRNITVHPFTKSAQAWSLERLIHHNRFYGVITL